MLSQTNTGTAVALAECSGLDGTTGYSSDPRSSVDSEEVDSPLLYGKHLTMEYFRPERFTKANYRNWDEYTLSKYPVSTILCREYEQLSLLCGIDRRNSCGSGMAPYSMGISVPTGPFKT